MTQPRHPKSGKYVKRASLLGWLASVLKGRPDKSGPTLIEHDPSAQERNTTRTTRK